MTKIIKIIGREIIDSRGDPTVEAEVHLQKGNIGIASVPSGVSVGSKEAIELRDNNKKRFLGKGVLKSVSIINNLISKKLKGLNSKNQNIIDEIMIELDGTKNKSKLGANTILAVSLANAKAAAIAARIPLYKHIANLNGSPNKLCIPFPRINIINGGKHANNNIEIQEFMIQPIKAKNFKNSVQIGAEIFHNLKKILKAKKLNISFGDEGGYTPNLKSNAFAFELIKKSVEKSGYIFGKDVTLAIDCAASEFYNFKTKNYEFKEENKIFNSTSFTNYLKKLIKKYPIDSIEDGLYESDWKGFAYQTKILGNKIQLVGDDLFATNPELLKKGIKNKIVNAILIKPNQIGTLSETLSTIKLAKSANYEVIISHRSGETEDLSIVDLAVGTATKQIKLGSITRSERVAKYNHLIRIEEQLENRAKLKVKNNI